MVYCLNLVMVYTLHSGGVENPFLCGHSFHFGVDTHSTLVWTLIPLWCGHSFHFGVDTHFTLVWTLIPLWYIILYSGVVCKIFLCGVTVHVLFTLWCATVNSLYCSVQSGAIYCTT